MGMGFGNLRHLKLPSEIRKLVYYNFWNMELDELIDELGNEKEE